MRRLRVLLALWVFGFVLLAQDKPQPDVEQLQAQLKSANERIAQLDERIKLMTMQQQGAIQFFQAGQALCELDKQPKPQQ